MTVYNERNRNIPDGYTLKNIPAGTTVYGRGYVIYTDGTNEGIIYTEEAAK